MIRCLVLIAGALSLLTGMNCTAGPSRVTIRVSSSSMTSDGPVVIEVIDGGGIDVRTVAFHHNRRPHRECPDVASPSRCTWSVTGADNGTHHWQGIVGDSHGNTWPSNVVQVQVNISPGRNNLAPTGADLVGLIPAAGTARDVVVDGSRSLAYVTSDEFGLSVFDVSDPSAPVAIGAPIPTFRGGNLAVDESTAVVSGSERGLHILDVSDPSAPEPIGLLEGVIGNKVALEGQFAYVLSWVAGNPPYVELLVVDLRVPESPTVATRINVGSGNDVEVAGSRAYVTNGSSLEIFDISNPLAPQRLGSAALGGGGRVEVQGDFAYVGGSRLTTVNVRNPRSPFVVSSVEIGTTLGLSISSNRAYLVNGGVLRIFDVSNPAGPWLLSTSSGHGAWGISVVGSVAVLASPAAQGGLFAVDVSRPEIPQTLSHARGTVGNAGVAAAGTLAVISGTANGIKIVDVSDPWRPEPVTQLEGVTGGKVGMAGQFAYVLDSVPGNPPHVDLVVVDLRTPENPIIATRANVGSGNDVAVVGSLAYVATGVALQIFDISNPLILRSLGSAAVGGGRVSVDGDFAYVSGGTLYAIDVRNPNDPFVVGSLSVGTTTGVAASEGRVYLVNSAAMRVVDVSNPAAPSLLSTTDGFGAWDIEVVGSLALLASPTDGLVVYDVSDPTAPEWREQIRVPGAANSIAIDGGFAYVGDTASTLDIITLNP